MKKLILLDVDGTLISYDAFLPPSAVDAIHQAQANGHLVFIVTGRSKGHVEKEILDIGFDGMIGGNGAYIEYHQQVLKEKTISEQDVQKIINYLDNHHLAYFVESIDGLYGSSTFEKRGVRALEQYGFKNAVIREIYPEMTFPESMLQPRVIKINYILESYDDYLNFKAAFPHLQTLTWGGQGETAIFGDAALKDIDKAKAIAELKTYLGIEKKDIIAFGDAEVDIPMFQAADISVCLGGGRKAAKEAADYITDTVENDGLYKAFQYFHLI